MTKKNMISSTIEECDRLLDMINTMLLISKTEAGVGKFTYEKMNLSKVVRDACALFHPLAEDKGINMSWEIQDESYLVGDIRMIQRLISNLLDNAIKYTHARETVEVLLHAEGQESVMVSFKDTGTGISARDLPHIFERFCRGDPSRTRTGAGLGLCLAKTIAQAHGGDIAVVSSPNNGSTFTVTLPRSPPMLS